jgi:hypothetical protein
MKSAHDESPACSDGRGTSFGRDIGALFRRHGDAYRRANTLGAMERRALRDISVCRTGALGGHRDVCGHCGLDRTVYNSCRNRHCPKCQALRQVRWVAARMERALPVRHFHVVFTVPAELRPLVREHKILLLDLLFATASETILQLCSTSMTTKSSSARAISKSADSWSSNSCVAFFCTSCLAPS